MLMDIKALLIERNQMTIIDLARYFHVSESIMLGMLSHWQKKGRIETVDASGQCGSGTLGSSCGGCTESVDSKIFYRWKATPEKPIYIKNKG